MKTDTRSHIVKMIETKGKVRPVEIKETLHITAQAVHYHLRGLVEQGIIEAKGSVPFTEYTLAGMPDFENAFKWMAAIKISEGPSDFVCETRDTFATRLSHLVSIGQPHFSSNILSLVISTAGEIGNNSFDHNLGQWRDIPGCWFEAQCTGTYLWICIADRGQGVYQSLKKAHPEFSNDQAALKAAFETVISGRAPEQRGNGLKFARANVLKAGGGLACMSGTGRVFYGENGEKCMTYLEKNFHKVEGTITLMMWGRA